MSISNRQSQRVELGRFGKVYGIKGWVRLNSFTHPPDAICQYSALTAEIAGKEVVMELDEFRTQGKGLVVHVKGYDDPETARVLTGAVISVESCELPELAAGEYYWHQLLGLQVRNQHDAIFGEVVELLETGANDVLVVQPGGDSLDQRQRLIPYLMGTVVQQINLEDGWIRVEWEADYLE